LKKLLLISIAALLLTTGIAHAAQPLWLPSAQYEKPTFDKEMLPKPPSHFPLLPPSKYDRPHVGRLTLEISADPNCLGNAIACTQGGQLSCQIKMMPDEVNPGTVQRISRPFEQDAVAL
jgi:hypothetical protein